MAYADFSGREIVAALRTKRYRPIGRTGSHVKLRYEHPETDEVRVVTVPMSDADHISQDTTDRSPTSAARTTSSSGASGSTGTRDR